MSIRHAATVFAAALLLSATRCSTQPVPAIYGKVAVSGNWKPVLYLVQPRNFAEIGASYSGVVVDSAAIAADGTFAFQRPMPKEATLFTVCIQPADSRYNNRFWDDNPLNANYMPLVAALDKPVEFTADAVHFQASFQLKNAGADNLALLQLRDLRHRAYREHLEGINLAHPDESQLLEAEAALRRFQSPLMAFADSSALLWPALVAARWVSPTGDYERIPEFAFGLGKKWQQEKPENSWVAQLCQAGSREKLPVMTGDMIPDYPLPMADGDTIMLHRLLGKRLTILDIWASWCMPCRRENKEVLAPIWSKYREKGLVILGYSIDSSPAGWKAAIAKDGASWRHASHLSGDATPFLEVLRISTIPANFILDSEGKVVAKNLHGDALRSFVAEYFK